MPPSTRAAARIAGVAHRTPVMTSRTADARTGGRLFFKCENLQRVGAFKFRGAYNAVSALDRRQRRRGVVAFSSGNHAQAMALAGRLQGTPVVIVMPEDAPAAKIAATRGYGAEVVLYDRYTADREAIGRGIAAARGLALIPPYDHPDVIAGQGTAAKELIEETGPLDLLLVCLGGGGLLAGSALAAEALRRAAGSWASSPRPGTTASARSARAPSSTSRCPAPSRTAPRRSTSASSPSRSSAASSPMSSRCPTPRWSTPCGSSPSACGSWWSRRAASRPRRRCRAPWRSGASASGCC